MTASSPTISLEKASACRTDSTFVGNTARAFATQVTRYGLTAVAWLLVARTAGPAALGQLQLILVFVSWVVLFTDLGLPIANGYFVAKRLYSIGDALGYCVLRAVTASITAIVFLTLARTLILKYIPLPPTLYVLAMIWVSVQIANTYLMSLLTAQRRFAAQFRVGLIQGIGTLLVMTGLVVWPLQLGVRGALIAMIMGTLLSAISQAALYSMVYTWRMLHPKARLHRDYIRFGMRGYFANATQLFAYRFDTLVVGYFAGATDLGVYAVAYTAVEFLWYCPMTVAAVLMPTTASSTPVAANSRTARVSRLTLLFAVSTGIIFAVLAAPMTVLLGPRFSGALVLAWILLPGSTLFSLAKVLAADLSGRGHPEFCTYCSGGAFVLSVILDLLLIPRYGVTAAAGISSFVYVLQTLYFLHCCHSVTSLSYRSLLVPTRTDITQSIAAIASQWARIRNARQVAMVSHLS